MSLNKKNEFDKNVLSLADFAKALSHPARLAILKTLAQRNECICGEIVDVLPLAQATVSQHLLELKNAGLIKGRVDGVKSCYCINWETLEKFNTQFNEFFLHAKELSKCC